MNIKNIGENSDFQNVTLSADPNIRWFANSTQSTININIMNLVLARRQK